MTSFVAVLLLMPISDANTTNNRRMTFGGHEWWLQPIAVEDWTSEPTIRSDQIFPGKVDTRHRPEFRWFIDRDGFLWIPRSRLPMRERVKQGWRRFKIVPAPMEKGGA